MKPLNHVFTDADCSNSSISLIHRLIDKIVEPAYDFVVHKCALNYTFQAIVFEEEKPGGKIMRKPLGGK